MNSVSAVPTLPEVLITGSQTAHCTALAGSGGICLGETRGTKDLWVQTFGDPNNKQASHLRAAPMY